MTRLLTETDVADVLGLTSRQVLRLARLGQLPFVRLPGNAVRFEPADLAVWIAARRVSQQISDAIA